MGGFQNPGITQNKTYLSKNASRDNPHTLALTMSIICMIHENSQSWMVSIILFPSNACSHYMANAIALTSRSCTTA